MKKVWILEKFESKETLIKQLKQAQIFLRGCKKDHPQQVVHAKNAVTALEKLILNNPEGVWHGWEGKVIYSQFCHVAKQALKSQPDEIFRVVEAQIEDDSKYWLGYTNPVVNENVLRYLRRTC